MPNARFFPSRRATNRTALLARANSMLCVPASTSSTGISASVARKALNPSAWRASRTASRDANASLSSRPWTLYGPHHVDGNRL